MLHFISFASSYYVRDVILIWLQIKEVLGYRYINLSVRRTVLVIESVGSWTLFCMWVQDVFDCLWSNLNVVCLRSEGSWTLFREYTRYWRSPVWHCISTLLNVNSSVVWWPRRQHSIRRWRGTVLVSYDVRKCEKRNPLRMYYISLRTTCQVFTPQLMLVSLCDLSKSVMLKCFGQKCP